MNVIRRTFFILVFTIAIGFEASVLAQESTHIDLPYQPIFDSLDKDSLNRDASWREKQRQETLKRTPQRVEVQPPALQRVPAALHPSNADIDQPIMLPKTPLRPEVVRRESQLQNQTPSSVPYKDFKHKAGANVASYFIEVRRDATRPIKLMDSTNHNGIQLGQLNKGNIIRVSSTEKQYIIEKRAEFNDMSFWRSIEGKEKLGEKKMYFNHYWKELQTLNPYEPVKLLAQVPQGQRSVTVFSRPGHKSWRECQQLYDLCSAYVDEYTDIELLDSKYYETARNSVGNRWTLYYKVKFEYIEKNGTPRAGQGWILANHAKRKVDGLKFNVYKFSRSPASAFKTKLGNFDEKNFYAFNKNLKNPNIYKNRYMNETRLEDVKLKGGLFDMNLSTDAITEVNYTSLDQPFLNGNSLNQYGVGLGARVGAPLFLDLDLEGSLIMTVPITAEGQKGSYFLEADQWFNFTLPARFGNMAVKWGLGGYYYLMMRKRDEFGFSSLNGFQTRIMLESERMWFSFKFAPLGSNLEFSAKNSQIGIAGGYRLYEAKSYESMAITGAIKSSRLEPKGEELKELDVLQVQLGFIIPF